MFVINEPVNSDPNPDPKERFEERTERTVLTATDTGRVRRRPAAFLQPASPYTSAMEFRILGPVEAADDSGRIALGGPQQRRVLAALLSEPGKVLGQDRLLEILWPDGEPPENARRTAISYLSRLRAALGDGWVSTKDAGYRIDVSGASIDANRFATLVDAARTASPARAVDVLDEALVLWRGPVFGDLADEWWARPTAARLEELRLTALADRIDALIAAGWERRALAEAQTAVAAHPLRPPFVERLMRVLHASGRTDEALRAFQDHRRDLIERTGLDPSPDLVALERSIAAGVEPIGDSGTSRALRGYLLRDTLGVGSFGTVYRATQPSLGRDVAIKVIRAELADDRSFIHRFEAEAQVVARLEHAHIVPLYDFWREPGGAYLVFRLLRGGSAEQALVAGGPFTLDRATLLVEQIGSALSAAHAAGVVHRDVKPANILFDDEGQAYLADFGIATTATVKAAGQADAPSTVRLSAGSPMYASPEQARDGIADGRADQYGLAATMWELLAGDAPFVGTTASAVMTAKLSGPLVALQARNPSVTARLDEVLARASAVHPDDRFDDIATFVAAWRAAVVPKEVLATDPVAEAGLMPARTTLAGAATAKEMAGLIPNPYKGLRSFQEVDSADFFGRTELTAQLHEVVKDHGFAAVVGPSGSGKSSLVLAGLVPELRLRGALVVTMTPGSDPFAALSTALSELATEQSAPSVASAELRRIGGVPAAARAVGSGEELVIVVDQLEELWTSTQPEDRERFTGAIAELGEQAGVRVVVTIRADWFDRPLRDPNLGPVVARATFGVTPMRTTELHEAIIGPAGKVGVRFEPGLVGRIIAETLDQPGSLPLLQFALTELFEQRSGATITSVVYDDIGGLAGAVAHQAEAIHESFSSADRAAVRRMFARLVTAGDGAEDTRRRALRGELAGIPEPVVAAFVDRRLLTLDRDRDSREPTLEVAHEALLRSWPRLREWLDEDRGWVRELRSLSGATALWQAGGRDDADLFRGARLAVVSELAADRSDALTPDESSFLAASEARAVAELFAAQERARATQRQNRRLRRSLVGLALVVVAALIAGGLAVGQRRRADHQASLAAAQAALAATQAKEAETQRNAAETATKTATDAERRSAIESLVNGSIVLRSSQQDLAALLAVEAYRLDPTAKTRSGLFATFTRNPGFMGYRRVEGTKWFGAVFPLGNGPAAIAQLSDGQLVRLDLDTGAIGDVLAPPSSAAVFAQNAAISGDQRVVVNLVYDIDSQRSQWQPFDVATGQAIAPLTDAPIGIGALALNRDGSLVAFGGASNGEVVVERTADDAVVGTVRVNEPTERIAHAVRFGPDDRLYAGGEDGRIHVVDTTSMTEVVTYQGPPHGVEWDIHVAPDGSYLIANGSDSVVRIELPSGTISWSFVSQNSQVADKNPNEVPCTTVALAAATADVTAHVYCADAFGSIAEYDATTGTRSTATFDTQAGNTANLTVTSDGQLIAPSNNTNVISRWRLDGAGPIQRVVAHDDKFEVRGYDSSGRLLMVGQPSGKQPPFHVDWDAWDVVTDRLADPMDATPLALWAEKPGQLVGGFIMDDGVHLGIYDLTTQARVPGLDVVLDLSKGIPRPMVDAAHHRLFLASSDGTVRTFDEHGTETGPTIEVDGRDGAQSVSASVDGTQLVISTLDGVTAVYDAATGKLLGPSMSSIWNSRISNAGIGVGSTFDGTMQLFDPATLTILGELAGSRGAAQDMQFSADGSLLLVKGGDRRITLHDVTGRTQLGDPIVVDAAAFNDASLRPDGKEMAIPNGHTGITLWDLDPARWADAACSLAGRNLTQEEWDTYLAQFGPYHVTCSQFAAGTAG